jgi:hypothetical protein
MNVLRGLSVVLVLMLVGCGGDDTDAPPPLDRTQLRMVERFTPAQFESLERVLRASNKVDRAPVTPALSDARIDARLRPMAAACDGLDATHPLLGVLRSSCTAQVKFSRASLQLITCDGDCMQAARASVETLRAAVDASRRDDRAVRATRLKQACKRSLVTSQSTYRALVEFDTALDRLAFAYESGTEDDQAEALQELALVEFDSGPSPAASRQRFRRACRP